MRTSFQSVLLALFPAVILAGTAGCASLNASRTDPAPSETETSHSAPPTWLKELCPSAPAAGNSGGAGVWCIESNDRSRKFQFDDLHAFLVRLDHAGDGAYQIRIDFPDVVTSADSVRGNDTSRPLATLELRTRPFSSLTHSDVRAALQRGLIATFRTSPFDSEKISFPPSERWDAGKHKSRIDAQLRAFTPPVKPDADNRQPSDGEFAMTGTFEYPAGSFAESEPSTVHLAVDVDDLPVVDAQTAQGAYRDPDGSEHKITGAWASYDTRDHHLTLHYANQFQGRTNWHVAHFWQAPTEGGITRGTIDPARTDTPGEMSYRTTYGHPLTVPSWPKVDTATRWPTGPAPDAAPFKAGVDWLSEGTISVRSGRYCKSQASTCPPDSVADRPVEFDIRRASTLRLADIQPLDVADANIQSSSASRTDARKTTDTSLPAGSTASIAMHRPTRSTRISFENVWAQSRPFPFDGRAASAWQQMSSETRSPVPSNRQLLVEFPAVAGASDDQNPRVTYMLEVRRFAGDRRQFPARLISSQPCDPDALRACLEDSGGKKGIVGTFLLESVERGSDKSTLTGKFRSNRRRDQPRIQVALDGIDFATKQLDGLETSWVYRLKTDARKQLPSGWITIEPDREIVSVYAQRTTPNSQARGHHVYKLENDSPGLQAGAYVTDIKWADDDEDPVERATVVVLRELDDRTVELAEYWLDDSDASSLGIDAEGPIQLDEPNLRELGTQMAEFATTEAWRRPTFASPVLLKDFQ